MTRLLSLCILGIIQTNAMDSPKIVNLGEIRIMHSEKYLEKIVPLVFEIVKQGTQEIYPYEKLDKKEANTLVNVANSLASKSAVDIQAIINQANLGISYNNFIEKMKKITINTLNAMIADT